MTKDEALKLALEALEQIARLTGPRWALENSYAGHLEAITALREALAQPEQKQPTDIGALVQGMAVSVDVSTGDHDAQRRLFGTVTLVQESQKGKHGLILLVQNPQPNFTSQPQPKQEPVAKYIGECSEGSLVHLYDDVKKGTNFYTTPPQRTWVDLKPQDLNDIFKTANTGEGAVHLALKIIKEKNT